MRERPAGLVNKRRLRERDQRDRERDHTPSLIRRRRRLRERPAHLVKKRRTRHGERPSGLVNKEKDEAQRETRWRGGRGM